MAAVDITNMFLQADSENKVAPSRQIVTKVIDVITLIGQGHDQMTSERKGWLKMVLPEGYRNLCEQDHSGSIYLSGDDLVERSKMVKATHLMHQNLSVRKLYKPCS